MECADPGVDEAGVFILEEGTAEIADDEVRVISSAYEAREFGGNAVLFVNFHSSSN